MLKQLLEYFICLVNKKINYKKFTLSYHHSSTDCYYELNGETRN